MRTLVLLGVLGSLFGCGGGESTSPRSDEITVAYGAQTCPVAYAEGPFPAVDVVFGAGTANVPLPPVFAEQADAGVETRGWQRTDVALDGTPSGVGSRIVACGLTAEVVTRVTGTAPLAIERKLTWTGTRTATCDVYPTPPPSGCLVEQRVVYPVDAPKR
jgi:hypothetical protein